LTATADARTTRNASLALVANAFVWGTSWWPLRQLQGESLHPLWTTALVYLLASLGIIAARPRAVGQLLRTPVLWLLLVASGVTNATFNWAIVVGDVVRVVLLFYLMPLWAVVFARLILGERLGRGAALRIALGAAGAAIVLWPSGPAPAGAGVLAWLPLPATLADWLGLVGGAAFAFNNVMLRREGDRPAEARALAMFLGGAVVAGVLATSLTRSGVIAPLPAIAAPWLLGAVALALAFVASNLALQYGAARLPAHRTAVVMLTEVVFASASALVLGAGTMSAPLALGGALIVAGALLAALAPDAAAPAI
jgi:drug/metabolite transporter (DMT)-like permease